MSLVSIGFNMFLRQKPKVVFTHPLQVAIMPEVDEVEVEIDPKDFELSTARSGGAGGWKWCSCRKDPDMQFQGYHNCFDIHNCLSNNLLIEESHTRRVCTVG
ncbi:hypothetical protein LguiA_021201 [Lonicera macranthoides]